MRWIFFVSISLSCLAADVSSKQVLVQNVKGILVVPDGDRPGDYVIKTTRGAQVYRALPNISFSQRQALQKKLDKMFVNRPLTVEGVEQLKRVILHCCEANGQALVVANVSPQDIENGVVIVTVLEAKLGKVTVRGNTYFPTEWYLKQLPFEEGAVVPTRAIDEDIAWINATPWHKAQVAYKSGEVYGTADVDIVVQDARPLNVFMGFDNTGLEFTSPNRMVVGLNWGNFFAYDHQIAFSYTAALDFSSFQRYKLCYTAPLPGRDQITITSAYASLSVPAETADRQITGQAYEVSPRYVLRFHPIGKVAQKGQVGMDWKRTNSDLFFSNTPTEYGGSATVLQLAASYECSVSMGPHAFSLLAEGYLQPWTVGEGMRETAYDQHHFGAKTTYAYGRFTGEYIGKEAITGITTIVKAKGQVARKALPSSELLGLGGVNSVRGYVERAVNVDNGWMVTMEVHSPSIRSSKKRVPGRLYGVAFLDMAGGRDLRNPSAPSSTYYLAGFGPGLRYDMGSWIHLCADLGIKLTRTPTPSSHSAILWPYFSLVASY